MENSLCEYVFRTLWSSVFLVFLSLYDNNLSLLYIFSCYLKRGDGSHVSNQILVPVNKICIEFSLSTSSSSVPLLWRVLLLKLYFKSFFLSLSLVRWMEGESQIVKFFGFVRILCIRNIEFTPRLKILGAAWKSIRPLMGH